MVRLYISKWLVRRNCAKLHQILIIIHFTWSFWLSNRSLYLKILAIFIFYLFWYPQYRSTLLCDNITGAMFIPFSRRLTYCIFHFLCWLRARTQEILVCHGVLREKVFIEKVQLLQEADRAKIIKIEILLEMKWEIAFSERARRQHALFFL